jgi:drug/metabolite transporter (DMT)-like permease
MARRWTVYVLVAALLWSAGGVGVKTAAAHPMALAGWRSAFAAPVLVAVALVAARRSGVRARALFRGAFFRRPLPWLSALSYAVMVVSYVVSTKLTTAANSILIQYTGPIYVALLSWPLLRERVRGTDWLATGGCLLGMLLFFADKVSSSGAWGNGLAVLSSLGFAGVPLLLRLDLARHAAEGPDDARTKQLSPYLAMALGNVVATALCLPWMLSAPMAGSGWRAAALLGIFQIGFAYGFYGAAVGNMPALRSTLLACVEPVLNPLWVLLATGERPSFRAALGGVLILGSVVLQAIGQRAAGPPSEPEGQGRLAAP